MEQQSTPRHRHGNLGQWTMALYAVPNMPLVQPGDNLAALIYGAASQDGFAFRDGDIVVVAQKVVSKAENAIVRLADIEPSRQAVELAEATGRDPRLCEVYLRESQAILGTKGRMVLTHHRLGFVCTSAGVDRTNVGPEGEDLVALLPADPDASARAIRESLRVIGDVEVAVIISDSGGRPNRAGSIGEAIGIAGIRHLEEHERRDLYDAPNRPDINLIDELAGAASVIMGETSERLPAVVIRGARFTPDTSASIRKLLLAP